MRKIFVAGHRGLVGSAFMRKLSQQDDVDLVVRDRAFLDLTNQSCVRAFIKDTRPDAVILAAAKVGGIAANSTYPADFIYENIAITSNVVHACYDAGVSQLLNFGSSCMYPPSALQPLQEETVLTGPLEPTNEAYAVAKIAAQKLCESFNLQYGTDYRTIVPTNLYGLGDNFHPEHSHVVPAMIRRFHEAHLANLDEVVIWGTGAPIREFLFIDDMVDAAMFVLNSTNADIAAIAGPQLAPLNIASGQEVSILELARLVAKLTGYKGRIITDPSKPDGFMRKALDGRKLRKLGWRAQTKLVDGLDQTVRWYAQSPHALD